MRTRTFILAAILSLAALPVVAGVVAPDAAAVPADTPAPSPIEPYERLGDPARQVDSNDVLAAARGADRAIQRAMDSADALAIMGGLAAVLWALLAAIRRWGDEYLSGRTIRVITLVVSPVALLLGTRASGVSWPSAITIALGGPGALALNELGRIIKPPTIACPQPGTLAAAYEAAKADPSPAERLVAAAVAPDGDTDPLIFPTGRARVRSMSDTGNE